MKKAKYQSKKRRNAKGAINIPPAVISWLNGTPGNECGEPMPAAKYFAWCDYAGGLQGLVDYCQKNGLMGETIPEEVARALKSQPKGRTE